MALATVQSAQQASPSPRPRFRENAWGDYMKRIAARDQAALALLYDESSAVVYGLALRMLRDQADAEEVTLDVYTQVWKQAARFEDARGSVPAWLVMLARSRAIDRIRARRRRLEVASETLPESQSSATDGLKTSQGEFPERRALSRAIQSLPQEQQKLVQMAFYDGYTHSELATLTGLPLGTVKTRIRLAMTRLREHMANASGMEVRQ